MAIYNLPAGFEDMMSISASYGTEARLRHWVLLPCAHLFTCDKAVVRDTIHEQENRAL